MAQDVLRVSTELLDQARRHMDVSQYQEAHCAALEGVCSTPLVPANDALFELLSGLYAVLGCSCFLMKPPSHDTQEKGVDYFCKLTEFAALAPEPSASHWAAVGRFNLGLVRLQLAIDTPCAYQSPTETLRSAAAYFRLCNEEENALLAEGVADTGNSLALQVMYR